MPWGEPFLLVACGLLAVAVLACSSTAGGSKQAALSPSIEPVSTSTSTPASSLEPGHRPVPAEAARTTPVESIDVTLKVMSFNLYWGAGVERRFDKNVRQQYRGRDRSSELIAFLQDAAPDVLAVQEAAGWNGDPAFARQVADALGMSYVLAPDAWELHVILFSKYPIVAADYVSRLQDFNGVALRATLAIAENVHVNVLAVHLNSMSPDTRTCQVEALFDMAAGLEGRTILLGDMNFYPTHPQANLMRLSGWQLVRAQDRWPIDQIWLDEPGSYTIGDWWEGVDAPDGISDHWPVGAEIGFSATPSDVGLWREPVTEPSALDHACSLP